MTPPVRQRRLLHPGAWWLWAGGLAAAAMRTTNIPLLLLVVGVAAYVVAARRQDAPWARSFGSFLRLGLVLIAFRMVLQVLFGSRQPGHVLVTLPAVDLPSWAAGVSIGGPVTAELLVDGFASSLRLAVVLVCFGAVNSLSSPSRLLRALPAVLYEAGVVVTVALAFAPQAVQAVRRVRDARRLRGRPTRGLRGVQGLALPVLEDALERSVDLAASMDARGYGRRGDLPVRIRRLVSGATAVGLLAVCVGLYGVLDAGAPRGLALPLLAAGSVCLAAGAFAAGRQNPRTRYRPDPWALPEWGVALAGVAVVAAFGVAANADPGALVPPSSPLAWPTVPVLCLAGLAAALTPAWVAPAPPPLLAGAEARPDEPAPPPVAVPAEAVA